MHCRAVEFRKKLLSRELRYSLFHLFANWSGHFSLNVGTLDRRSVLLHIRFCVFNDYYRTKRHIFGTVFFDKAKNMN
jgi:hypothetical protein